MAYQKYNNSRGTWRVQGSFLSCWGRRVHMLLFFQSYALGDRDPKELQLYQVPGLEASYLREGDKTWYVIRLWLSSEQVLRFVLSKNQEFSTHVVRLDGKCLC